MQFIFKLPTVGLAVPQSSSPLCLFAQSCPTLCDPMDCSLPGFSVHGDSPGKDTRVGLPCPPPGDLPNPGIEPRSPSLRADSLLFEPPGKPFLGILQARILEWVCHALLQGIFPTQGSNPHLITSPASQADSLPLAPPGKPAMTLAWVHKT